MKLSNEAIRKGFRSENGLIQKYTIDGRKRKNWKNRRGYSRQFIKNLCEKCETNKNLTVHHKIPLNKKKDYSKRNCQTLCRKCHDKEHNMKSNPNKKRKKLKKEKLKEESLLMLEKDGWGSYRII